MNNNNNSFMKYIINKNVNIIMKDYNKERYKYYETVIKNNIILL